MAVKKLDLKVGGSCNNNCKFCAAADKRDLGDKTTQHIKKDLRESKADGTSIVVFSGGEATIRKDILEIVSFARDIGYERVHLQTNGRMLAYKNFCDELANAGVVQFSIALHGHIPALHDYLTQSPGAYNQVVQAIKNLKTRGLFVVTNTVITKPNYRFLPQITSLLISLGVEQIQLSFVHPMGAAWDNFDMMVPWKSLVEPYMHKSLDIATKANVVAIAEAYPFCFMKNYEKYFVERFIPAGEIKDIDYFIPDFDYVRKKYGKSKGAKCRECKYDLICEGPWKEYPQKRGWSEFSPVKGQKIQSYDELCG